MRRYQVHHTTTYGYDDEVTDSLGIGHLVPRELPWQRVMAHELAIDPATDERREERDAFGNGVTHFAVHGPLPGGGQFSDEGAANHVRLAVPGRPAMPKRANASRTSRGARMAGALASSPASRSTRSTTFCQRSLSGGKRRTWTERASSMPALALAMLMARCSSSFAAQ